MASLDDVARMASELPEVTEGERYGNRTWLVGGKAFAWDRPFSKADIRRLGDQAPPGGPILAVRVEDLSEKEAVLAANPDAFFTIPHFDGYSAVLIQLPKVSVRALRDAITDAWLACAPPGIARQLNRLGPSSLAVCLSLGGGACGAGEMRRQELSGSVQGGGRFVEDRIEALEDVRHPRGDVEGDLDVGDSGLPREADGVVEENLVRSGLDDQGRQAGQVGEYRADQAESGVVSRRVVRDPGLQVFPAHQHVDLALGLHGRPGQGEVGVR